MRQHLLTCQVTQLCGLLLLYEGITNVQLEHVSYADGSVIYALADCHLVRYCNFPTNLDQHIACAENCLKTHYK